MPQAEQETMSFPLLEADAIIPVSSSEVPDNIDCIYTVVVDTPTQPRGQFGPVLAWKDKNRQDNVWKIYAPHSLGLLPMMKKRLDNLVDEESWAVNDTIASIFTGMVKKNDYSWDSLVQAYSKSNLWARNVINMIRETFSQASMMWWAALPAIDSDSSRMILALSKVNNDKRVQLEDQVEDFIKASAVFAENQHLSHNSSAYKSASSQLEHYTKVLRLELDEELKEATKHEQTADDGTVFLI